MPRKNQISTNTFDGHILSNEQYLFSPHHLSRIINLVESMTEQHNKILLTRVDLRYPSEMQTDGTNRDFSKTMRNLVKQLTRQKCAIEYVAKREQEQSHNPHYHVDIIVDGSKRQSSYGVIRDVEHHWANTLGLTLEELRARQLVYHCNKDPQGNYRQNSYMLRRGDRDFQTIKAKAIQQASYLGKVRDSDITPTGTKKLFVSQVRPLNKEV